MLRRRRLPASADALLVVDQDTINAAFATTLVLREAAHLVLHLALALSVVRLRHGRSPMACSLVHGALLGDVAVLKRSILGCRQHHALTVLGCSGRRLIEIEDPLECVLFAAVILIAQLRPGCRRCESLDRPIFLLKVLLNRHVAHESTLGRLDLIEQLSLVSNLDWKHLGRGAVYERSVLL